MNQGLLVKITNISFFCFLLFGWPALGQVPVVSNYYVVDLGALGGTSSSAVAINSTGQVAGNWFDSAGNEHAFLYSNGSMQDLGTLGGNRSVAFGINNLGQVVGFSSNSDTNTFPLNGHGFIYLNGLMQDLNNFVDPSSGWTITQASAINDSGQIAGQGVNNGLRDILYTKGSIQDIGAGWDIFLGRYFGINNSGQVVGEIYQYSQGAGRRYAFLYAGGSTNNIELIPVPDNARAVSINDSAAVVGYGLTNSDAFLYANGLLQDLGSLDENGSQANGINNSGQIVGISDDKAFLYANGLMYDLNTLVINADGWILQSATAINYSGQIVGFGLNPSGQSHAFLLNPVPPCPGWMIASNGFHQGDGPPNVPVYYGNANAKRPGDNSNFFDQSGHASTAHYGCALCSVATMLTSVPGLESMTPEILNSELTKTNVNGYSGALINWTSIAKATCYPIGFVDSQAITNQTVLNTYLQYHVCGLGDRVILALNTYQNGVLTTNGHYVLVVGQTGNDWKVFDPGWKHSYIGGKEDTNQLASLADHYTGFTTYSSSSNAVSWRFAISGVRTYRVGAASSANLCGIVHSPVEILATDPTGNRVGYDAATGSDVFEIEGASYVRDFQIADCDENLSATGDADGIKTFCVPSPSGGTYQVQLTGTAPGSYTFDIGTFWAANSGQATQTTGGPVDVGTTITNQFFVKVPAVITECSIVSNVFNLSFTTQSNVSYDVEGLSTLGGTNWAVLQTVTSTTGKATVSQAVTNDSVFFRIVAK